MGLPRLCKRKYLTMVVAQNCYILTSIGSNAELVVTRITLRREFLDVHALVTHHVITILSKLYVYLRYRAILLRRCFAEAGYSFRQNIHSSSLYAVGRGTI